MRPKTLCAPGKEGDHRCFCLKAAVFFCGPCKGLFLTLVLLAPVERLQGFHPYNKYIIKRGAFRPPRWPKVGGLNTIITSAMFCREGWRDSLERGC